MLMVASEMAEIFSHLVGQARYKTTFCFMGSHCHPSTKGGWL